MRVAGAALLVLASVVVAAPADGAFPGRNGRILFVTAAHPDDRRPAQKFRTIRPDGRRMRTIAAFDEFLDEGTGSVQWSPDGRRIVYHRAGQVAWTMRPDGRGRRRVVDDAFSPAWHPSGRRIVFSRGVAEDALLTVPARGGEPRALTAPIGLSVERTEWSAAAGAIAVAVWRTDGVSVQVIDDDGAPVRVLAEGGRSPAWSPDGRRIAYHDGTNVWVARPDGTRRRRLTAFPDRVELHDVAYSPDGRFIAFARRDDERVYDDRVWIMRSDGRRPRAISRSLGTIPELDWQPR